MSTDHTPRPLPTCPECRGRSIEFSGTGLDTQYKICSRWREPGHLSWDEMQERYREELQRNFPGSGRFA